MDYKEYNRKMFGLRLALIRAKHNLTQTALAIMIGCKQAEIGFYESGRRMPKDETIHKICDGLKEDFEWLKYGNDGFYDIYKNDDHLKLEIELLNKGETTLDDVMNSLKKLSGNELTYIKEVAEALCEYNDTNLEETLKRKYYENKKDVYEQRLIARNEYDAKKETPQSQVSHDFAAVKHYRPDLWEEFKNKPTVDFFINNIVPRYKEWLKDKLAEDPDFYKKKEVVEKDKKKD